MNGGKLNNFAEHSEKAFKTVFDVFLAKLAQITRNFELFSGNKGF